MKVAQLKINDFHQFQDFTIDLTYPKGHPKAGQPLDKVCFIGQSGTGKTSLLELIPFLIFGYEGDLVKKHEKNTFHLEGEITQLFGFENEYEFTCRAVYVDRIHPGLYSTSGNALKYNKKIEISEAEEYLKNIWLNNTSTKPIYYPANINFNINTEDNNYSTIPKDIIDYGSENIPGVWHVVLDKIKAYQNEELKMRLELSRILEAASSNPDSVVEATEKLKQWKNTVYNPLQDIADNCLDELLAPYQLRVITELNLNSIEELGFIKIEDFNGKEIPHGLWSTGTKQVILTALPLYVHKPKHTIILIDEPERSLYPDMQRFIVDYYASLTSNCQFFYATHSPIIASNFEPWEIVELKFNELGFVYRELYYEGENHVNNYKWNPKFMRWDDILQRVFDMETDGSPERKQKLDELATCNIKYKKLLKVDNAETKEAKELLQQIGDLRKELSKWD